MSDDDKDEMRGKGGKPALSGRSSSAMLTVPSDTTDDPDAPMATDGRPSRGNLPVRLSTELVLKAKTQMSRVDTIKSILNSIPVRLTTQTGTTMTDVEV